VLDSGITLLSIPGNINICIYFTFIPNTIVIKTNQTKQILENIANILNDVMLCINKPLTHNS